MKIVKIEVERDQTKDGWTIWLWESDWQVAIHVHSEVEPKIVKKPES